MRKTTTLLPFGLDPCAPTAAVVKTTRLQEKVTTSVVGAATRTHAHIGTMRRLPCHCTTNPVLKGVIENVSLNGRLCTAMCTL